MKMRYFILYYNCGDEDYDEFYLKGKSLKHVQERIERYSNGILCTSKGCLVTSNISSGFLLEVDPPKWKLSKNEFGIINENRSYDRSEFEHSSGLDCNDDASDMM